MSKILRRTRMFIMASCSRIKSFFLLALEPRSCYHSRTVRHAVHIVIAVAAIVLLVRPLDCFGAGMTREAAECCRKGNCHSAMSNDDCCKGTVVDSPQSAEVRVKAADHQLPVFAGLIPEFRGFLPSLFSSTIVMRAHSPPTLPSPSSHNLPLLI